MEDERLHAVWESEVDRLELDVIRTERLVKGLENLPAEPWSAPVLPGPMPSDLVERARELILRQEAAQAALGNALSAAQRQVAYADRVIEFTGRGPASPVYLDRQA